MNINIINMEYYDSFDTFEDIDVNKASASKECIFFTTGIF